MGRFKGGEFMNTARIHVQHGFSQFELTTKIVKNLNKYDITPTAKLVLILLTTHFNEEKNGAVVFPSMPYISETLGISLTATKQAIKDLVNQGLILQSKREKIKGNYNKYILTQKVHISTVEQAENVSFKKTESDLSFIGTNKKNEINNKDVDKKDEKYLLQYAEKRGVKNKVAYINAIKKNGGASEIINEYKQIETKKRIMEQTTKTIIENNHLDAENSVPPTHAWIELGEKLRRMKRL